MFMQSMWSIEASGGRVGSAGLPVIIPRLLSRGCWDEAGEARCVYGTAARRGGTQAADGGESKERVQQRYSTAGLLEKGGGRVAALSDFDRSFKPISTRGTDYAHPQIFRPSYGPVLLASWHHAQATAEPFFPSKVSFESLRICPHWKFTWV